MIEFSGVVSPFRVGLWCRCLQGGGVRGRSPVAMEEMVDCGRELEIEIRLDEIDDVAMVIGLREVVPEPGSVYERDGEGRVEILSQRGVIQRVIGCFAAWHGVMA